ncbi:MAG: hypothetical protein RR365_08880 [Bacteroides sp.]
MQNQSIEKAYQTLGKHIFLASRAYSSEYEPVVILAGGLSEAMLVAKERFNTSNDRAIRIEQLKATNNIQVFEID